MCIRDSPITFSGLNGNFYDINISYSFAQGNIDGSYGDLGFQGDGMISQGYGDFEIGGGLNGEGSMDESITIKFWVTGAFEDEDSSMGDMNNDGSLNVYDVLLLVGIILDGDSGDIFDIMEIIKRV